MTEMREQLAPATQAVEEAVADYKGGEQMPLGSYLGLVGIYNAALVGLLAASASETARKSLAGVRAADLVLLGVATHKLSRVIGKDRVTSPLRAPFTEYEKPAGTSEVKEKVRGTGAQRALGDLLTCPSCLGPWVAAGLAAGFLFQPRVTRVVGGLFTAVAVADFLHLAYDTLKKAEEKQ